LLVYTLIKITSLYWGRRGRDRIVVGFKTTYAISATKIASVNPVHGVMYSIHYYMIKFVSDLRQVDDFFRFLLPIKLTATI